VNETPRKRIKQMDVMVSEVVRETEDTATLYFFTGNDRLDYKAGHFLTISPHQFSALERFIEYFQNLKGKKEPARAYSLCSAPDEKYLAVTIKEERYVKDVTKYPPLLSPLLVRRTVPGMKMVVTGFTGPYTLPDDVEQKTEHIVHVCAGSGGVPNFSILKFALRNLPTLKHTFIYSNKTWADVIFRDALDRLAKEHPDRLKLVHLLTRESGDLRGARAGRLSVDVIRSEISDPGTCMAFVCGPGISAWDKARAKEAGTEPEPRFLESALAALKSAGVAEDRIEYESYG